MEKAWIISVNMGYGHQRTAYPLRNLAPKGKVINANDYLGIPESDKKIWEQSRSFYELISRLKRIPLIGNFIFSVYDNFQKIPQYYPRRNLSKPTLTLKGNYSLMKKNWGQDLIKKLKAENSNLKVNLPIISTFFTPAFMAEFFDYPGEIFCTVCDADIARTWAPLDAPKSKIKYFAPSERVVERLKLYGIKEKNIFLTGYPLPLKNIGSEKQEILKDDLRYRILNLDPQKKYLKKYQVLVEEKLGRLPEKSDHLLTLMFSVGGAGAQKEVGIEIIKSLKKELKAAKLKVILSAGIRKDVKDYFEKELKDILSDIRLSQMVEILYQEKIEDYFDEFNKKLRKTDILWTKPSELSFYSALGLPIIVAPTIGSQEEFNKRWLLKSGFGMAQENPIHTDQWLFDWLDNGYLAEAAIEAFVEGKNLGTINIQKIISSCHG